MNTPRFVACAIWHDKMDDQLHHAWCLTKTSDEAWAHTIYWDGYLDGLSVNWPDRISRICSFFCEQDKFPGFKLPRHSGHDLASRQAVIAKEMRNPQPQHFVEHP